MWSMEISQPALCFLLFFWSPQQCGWSSLKFQTVTKRLSAFIWSSSAEGIAASVKTNLIEVDGEKQIAIFEKEGVGGGGGGLGQSLWSLKGRWGGYGGKKSGKNCYERWKTWKVWWFFLAFWGAIVLGKLIGWCTWWAICEGFGQAAFVVFDVFIFAKSCSKVTWSLDFPSWKLPFCQKSYTFLESEMMERSPKTQASQEIQLGKLHKYRGWRKRPTRKCLLPITCTCWKAAARGWSGDQRVRLSARDTSHERTRLRQASSLRFSDLFLNWKEWVISSDGLRVVSWEVCCKKLRSELFW